MKSIYPSILLPITCTLSLQAQEIEISAIPYMMPFGNKAKTYGVLDENYYLTLNKQNSLKAGLTSHSSVGKHCLSKFSDVKFATNKIHKYWDNKKVSQK